MAINKQIYQNGIKGLLSYYEIDSLPKDYEIFKPMFKEATDTKEGTRTIFSQDEYAIFDYNSSIHKPMSKLKRGKRTLEVLVNTFCGDKPSKTNTAKRTWFGKILSWMDFAKIKWKAFSLYLSLRKKWSEDEKQYRKAKK